MPKRRQPYSHTSLWITDCHQSSMGTSGCSRLCYANGKPITKGRRRCTVFGGPSLLFDQIGRAHV